MIEELVDTVLSNLNELPEPSRAPTPDCLDELDGKVPDFEGDDILDWRYSLTPISRRLWKQMTTSERCFAFCSAASSVFARQLGLYQEENHARDTEPPTDG